MEQAETEPVNEVTISKDELLRLQEQLVDLRSEVYTLREQKQRSDKAVSMSSGIHDLPHEENKGSLANKFMNRAFSHKDKTNTGQLETEITNLRRKLAVQEEEFRLQQQTMRDELQEVISRNGKLDELVKQLSHSQSDSKASQDPVNQSSTMAESNQQPVDDRIQSLQESNEALTAKIAELNEKFRRKQESYLDLAKEKSTAVEDAEKRFSNMENKLTEENVQLKAVIEKLNVKLSDAVSNVQQNEKERSEEKALLQSTQEALAESNQRNQSMLADIQKSEATAESLREDINALHNQLSEAKHELDEALQTAETRKNTIDQQAVHLEDLKLHHQDELSEQKVNFDRQIELLEAQLAQTQTCESVQAAHDEEMAAMKNTITLSEQKLKETKAELEVMQTALNDSENMVADKQSELKAARAEAEQRLDDVKAEHAKQIQLLTCQSEVLLTEKHTFATQLNDKDERLKILEKKYKVKIRELTKQAGHEKVRADKLESTLRQLGAVDMNTLNAAARQASPGSASFEEVRSDDGHSSVRNPNKSASVCSWQMVAQGSQPNLHHHHDKDENGSVCSEKYEVLETDTVQLIAKVTSLQKEKCELADTVGDVQALEYRINQLAEENNQKSTVIEQYIFDGNNGNGHMKLHTGDSPRSVDHRLPPSLRRMVELMKIDLSAGDIREMNRKLQNMLEETLTKNMQLQKDLDVLSQKLVMQKSANV